MKETSFIDQNKEKWTRFEKLYESNSHDPEELSNLYMDLTDDLSYAQTFYKRRTVRVYLNQLAQKIFTGVHKQKGESLKKLITVWQISLPLEIYRSRKNLLFALVAFLVYCFVGVITTHFDPDFPRMVMGDGYVESTLENIKNGNPLAVYESDDQLSMFVRITTNNMKVAFLTFFIGFFFTIGTHILMFYNGVMLGAFQYFFYMKGLLITSFLGIWIHGSFEISAIVLAGGAGLTAGNGLLFPKSYTRLQSMQLFSAIHYSSRFFRKLCNTQLPRLTRMVEMGNYLCFVCINSIRLCFLSSLYCKKISASSRSRRNSTISQTIAFRLLKD